MLIIFQSELKVLFHFHGVGIVVHPVEALRLLQVRVNVPSVLSAIFQGDCFVILLSINCSSIIPVARVYDCAELLIPPLVFQRFNTLSKKLVVIIVSNTTTTKPTSNADH